jgi:hypothetical protein
MLSIVGLMLNFFGSVTLASIAIKSKGRILGISRQIVPVEDSNADDSEIAYDKALLRMPKVKQQIFDSYVAIFGLALLTIGFLLQLISAIWS